MIAEMKNKIDRKQEAFKGIKQRNSKLHKEKARKLGKSSKNINRKKGLFDDIPI